AHAQHLALGAGAGEELLRLGIDGQRPDVALPGVAEVLHSAARVDAQDVSSRTGAGVDRPVHGDGERKNLTVVAGVDDADLAVGGDLVDLPLIAGGDVEVAVLVLGEVPDVGGVEASQWLDLARQPHGALAADDGVLELRLLVVGRAVVVPDL